MGSRITSLEGCGSAWLVRAGRGGADDRLQMLRPADAVPVSVITWAHDGIGLEGLLAAAPGAAPQRLLVLLHGGPVSGLACGEHPDPSAWVSAGFAVFMPDLRASGIAGNEHARHPGTQDPAGSLTPCVNNAMRYHGGC